MKYISTRGKSKDLTFEGVVLQGLADDGGLYVPEKLPHFSESELGKMKSMSYCDLFFKVTKDFVGGEIPDKDYREIIRKSYANFNHAAIVPTRQIAENEFLLELFHGPTLAFKDCALQFLGNLLDYLLKKNGEKIAIVGATSGDTGSAAIEGCKKCESAEIFILHPYKRVSDVQRRQMTSVLDKNVHNIALKGVFDDCQGYVKKMFVDQGFLKGRRMVAVNSINWARIMGQIVYYFYCGLRIGGNGKQGVSFTVPTGNFGDIYAGFLAKKMGLSVEKLIIATNDNNILARFVADNDYSKKEMVETITPSMNIQVSSNFERMIYDIHNQFGRKEKLAELMAEFEKTGKLSVEKDILDEIRSHFGACHVNDEDTKKMIARVYKENGETLDPHTAIGVAASKRYIASDEYKGEYVVNLATAHPAKFPDAVIEAGAPHPDLPPFLEGLFEREERYDVVENDLEVVKKYIADRV